MTEDIFLISEIFVYTIIYNEMSNQNYVSARVHLYKILKTKNFTNATSTRLRFAC